MSKQAVVVVDFQNDYLTSGSWPLVGVDAAVQKAAKVIEELDPKASPSSMSGMRAPRAHRSSSQVRRARRSSRLWRPGSANRWW
jgi:nicotinamidase-related amidase